MSELRAERALRPAGRRDGGQRHALAASRPGRDDALERGARGGGGLHAGAGARWAADGMAVVAVAAGHFDTEALRKYPEPSCARRRAHRPAAAARPAEEHAWLVALLASPLGRALHRLGGHARRRARQLVRPLAAAALPDETATVPTEARRPARLTATGGGLGPARGRSVVVAQKPSKLLGRVRFPSPARFPRQASPESAR